MATAFGCRGGLTARSGSASGTGGAGVAPTNTRPAVGPNGTGGTGGAERGNAFWCTPGESRCRDAAIQVCAASSTWGPELSCGTGLACVPRGTSAGCAAASGAAPATGTWRPVKAPFLAMTGTRAPGTAQLLTDGRVLASGPECATDWYTFTPDASGSYENGTWATAATSPAGRLFHPSFVLRDGRFWTGGGEYLAGSTTRAENEVYDPVTDVWTVLPDMPEEIADAPSSFLGDGRVLVLTHEWPSTNAFLFTLDPIPTWTRAAPWSRSIGDSESSSLTLQDGSVLVGSRLFQMYQPWTDTWVDAAPPPGGAGVFIPPQSDEMGPFLLLQDGRAFVLGANSKNAIFTPGGAGNAGAWTPAADTPAPYNHSDAPSIVEPNGKVLTVASTIGADAEGDFDGDPGGGDISAVFYEYDPASDAWTLIGTPFSFGDIQRVVLLALPNGQIWASGPGSANAWLYTPTGAPQAAWRPQLGGVAAQGMGALTLAGARLNGATSGADLGDDAKMATNFPIVTFTDAAGRVYFGRSSNCDDTAPSRCASVEVVPPASIPDGTYAVHVVASGVGEDAPGQVTFAGPRAASIAAPGAGAPGEDAAAAVALTSPAPAGGATVWLSSSQPQIASVPPSVVVPAGATSATFLVHALSAGGNTTLRAATEQSPAFAASAVFGWSVTAVAGPSANPDGTTGAWTVELDQPAPPGGITVALASSNTALVTVPGSVSVPAGVRRATFTPTLVDPRARSARLYATLPGSAASGLFAWYVAALPAPATGATWTVSLNGPAPRGGLLIGLSSSDATVATVPGSVTIPTGKTSATFPVSLTAGGAGGKTVITAIFGISFVQTWLTR
jgi:hypothetical protein